MTKITREAMLNSLTYHELDLCSRLFTAMAEGQKVNLSARDMENLTPIAACFRMASKS